MAEKPLPPIDELRQAFRYDAASGKLYREALTARDQQGYLVGKALGRMVRAHRVVWALATGAWPDGDIDHIDGDVTNNRIENLRVVDSAANNKNQKLPRNNTSGVIGVSWRAAAGKWEAQIKVNRKRHHLGCFSTLAAAAAARRAAEERFGFHPNHGRVV